MRHILSMTMAMGAGLMALFLVDLADIFFLSLLKDARITAAMGFAGPILFFNLSICIGSSIAMGALVARAVGARKEAEGRRYATNVLIYGALFTGGISIVVWLTLPLTLGLLGAAGETKALATDYMRIILPSMPVLSVAMAQGSILRAIGDGRRSALMMFTASLTNVVLDPILIFGFGMGIEGAATATVIARIVPVVIGISWIIRHHDFLAPVSWPHFRRQGRPYFNIALPAILTNIATPVAHAYVTGSLAHYGDSAMSGAAVMWRIVPVAFFALYALSGAIGPIIGQNFGANRVSRVRESLSNSLLFVGLYVAAAALVLFFAQGWLISIFHIEGVGAELTAFYFTWLAVFYVFDGAMFASNAIFNNLGRPRLSTLFNWSRATLGTIPFVTLGAHFWGAKGVFIGLTLGGAVFSIASVATCYWIIHRLQTASAGAPAMSPAK